MEIKHPTNPNYTPTAFYYRNGKIWVHNIEAGTFEHPTIQTNQTLTKHVRRMLDEGFEVRFTNPK